LVGAEGVPTVGAAGAWYRPLTSIECRGEVTSLPHSTSWGAA
jgi:hypothetical protein